MQRLATRITIALLVLALAAVAAGLAGLDQALAARLGRGSDALGPLVSLLDMLALKHVSTFLLGALLVLAGAALRLAGRRRGGLVLLYVGAVQFAATTVADLAKPWFGRLRPLEAAAQQQSDVWFAGANSFPSGHTAFYFGLVLPVLLLWPRAGLLLLPVPLLVAAQRLLSLDHYLSDVAASLALAALLALALRRLLSARLGAAAASARSR